MAHGVPSEKAASSSEETMPLPYCSAPMSAAAAPPTVFFDAGQRGGVGAGGDDAVHAEHEEHRQGDAPDAARAAPGKHRGEQGERGGGSGRQAQQAGNGDAVYQFAVHRAQGDNAENVHAEPKAVVGFVDMEIVNVNKG